MSKGIIAELSSKDAISSDFIFNLRSYIFKKYPDDLPSNHVVIFADAIKRILDEKMPKFKQSQKEQIKYSLFSKTVKRAQFKINYLDIFEEILISRINGNSVVKEITNWLSEVIEYNIKESIVSDFIQNVHKALDESPNKDIDIIINEVETKHKLLDLILINTDKFFDLDLPFTQTNKEIEISELKYTEPACVERTNTRPVYAEQTSMEPVYVEQTSREPVCIILGQLKKINKIDFTFINNILFILLGLKEKLKLRKSFSLMIAFKPLMKRKIVILLTSIGIIFPYCIYATYNIKHDGIEKITRAINIPTLQIAQTINNKQEKVVESIKYENKPIALNNTKEINNSLNKKVIHKLNSNITYKMRATAYDLSIESCGKARNHPYYGITFSGTRAKKGKTVAVDPRVISIGSRLFIRFPKEYSFLDGIYIAEDTGGKIKGNRVDIFFGEDEIGSKYISNKVKEFGVRYVQVELL